MPEPDHKKLTVTFPRQGIEAAARAGDNLVHVARRAGVELETPCGGNGTCGGCTVIIEDGRKPPSPEDLTLLNREDLVRGARLSCRITLTDDLVVNTASQRDTDTLQILTRGRGRETELNPAVKRIEITVPEPTSEDQRADWERVKAAVEEKAGCSPPVPEPSLLRELPHRLRNKNRSLTLVTHRDDILDIPEDKGKAPLGVALDVGTTTVVGYLINLEEGRELAAASTLNLQAEHGYDVMTRITYAQAEEHGLETLQQKGIASVNRIIGELVGKAGVDASDIYHLTLVGNTCMHHLLLGLDPANIGLSPYVPVLAGPYALGAAVLGIEVNPRAVIDFLPNIAGFVGADATAVLLTTLLHKSEEVCIALDIGTNGEIAMGNREGILVCSTAAGPAFEGARISHGMRGSNGAIHQVYVENGQPVWKTIGDERPRGICGSGLLDAAALLLDHGLVDNTGRLLNPADVVGESSAPLKGRLYEDSETRGFVLAHPHETYSGAPIVLTQQDIRELQLAKGAIYAGIQILKRELGVSDEQVSKVYLAGAFGNYLNPASAMRIGLIPSMPLSKIVGIGNAAGHGARLALLSMEEMDTAAEIATGVKYMELAMRADFQDQFIQAIDFPAIKGC